jgi:hypothetical protein
MIEVTSSFFEELQEVMAPQDQKYSAHANPFSFALKYI